jgi:hypothetical protein
LSLKFGKAGLARPFFMSGGREPLLSDAPQMAISWSMSKVSRAHRIVLDDRIRLPGRFFGRQTASVLARL